jgi:DNA-binding Lrp family transcriptional regulator
MTAGVGERPVPRLDEVDERILWVLARDARIPNNRLAAEVGIAPLSKKQA